MIKSKKFKLNLFDYVKSFIAAIALPTLLAFQQSLSLGQLALDYKLLSLAALTGGVGYIIKSFLSGEKE